MDKHAEDEHQPPIEENDAGQATTPAKDAIAPGIPIVRTSTPRPSSYAPSSATGVTDFPSRAPAAPPLPEEPEARQQAAAGSSTGEAATMVPIPTEENEAPEFVWLFEYGLEMEPAYLNSPERLNGLALRYGPALLKGYELRGIELPNGRIAPTLIKCASQDSEVWGVLYRIPRRLLARTGTAPSLLDCAHPIPAFTAIQLRVQETYRNRSIDCITYIASQQQGQPFIVSPPEQRRLDVFFLPQLLRIGRQQGLPAGYLEALSASIDPPANDFPAFTQMQAQQDELKSVPTTVRAQTKMRPGEQDTEPLPALANDNRPALNDTRLERQPAQATRWLYVLALYLVLLLVAALALSVMQALAYWPQIFNTGFTPLGVPWYVLLYGLLGGCMSCMIGLGHQSWRPRRFSRRASTLPGFVIVTWFARPYLGAILAALAYFALNSGIFLLSVVPSQRYAMYAVIGTLAGLSEGRLFFRQRRS